LAWTPCQKLFLELMDFVQNVKPLESENPRTKYSRNLAKAMRLVCKLRQLQQFFYLYTMPFTLYTIIFVSEILSVSFPVFFTFAVKQFFFQNNPLLL